MDSNNFNLLLSYQFSNSWFWWGVARLLVWPAYLSSTLQRSPFLFSDKTPFPFHATSFSLRLARGMEENQALLRIYPMYCGCIPTSRFTLHFRSRASCCSPLSWGDFQCRWSIPNYLLSIGKPCCYRKLRSLVLGHKVCNGRREFLHRRYARFVLFLVFHMIFPWAVTLCDLDSCFPLTIPCCLPTRFATLVVTTASLPIFITRLQMALLKRPLISSWMNIQIFQQGTHKAQDCELHMSLKFCLRVAVINMKIVVRAIWFYHGIWYDASRPGFWSLQHGFAMNLLAFWWRPRSRSSFCKTNSSTWRPQVLDLPLR